MLFFVVLWYTCSPTSKHHGRAYLRRRFPDAGFWELLLHRFRLFHTFGKVLVDRAAAGLGRGFSASGGREERAKLDALAREERGLILLSAHAGSWQMSLAVLGPFVGRPLHVLMYKDAADNDKQFFEHSGQKAPFSIIDPRDGLSCSLAMTQALLRNEVVVLLGDRLFGSDVNVVTVPFLGGQIRLPTTPYALASATGASLAFCVALRTGSGKAALTSVDCMEVPRGRPTPEFCYPYALRYAQALEKLVEEHPYQFFNFHDMWEAHDENGIETGHSGRIAPGRSQA